MLLTDLTRRDRNWGQWLDVWAQHAQTLAFRAKVDRAARLAHDAAMSGRLFAGCSGGKDSVALAGVLAYAGIRRVPLCHAHHDLNVPGMESCAIDVAERLDFTLDIVEPDLDGADLWTFLATLHPETPIWEFHVWRAYADRCASGSQLIAYQYERGFDGAFSGVRADESKGRLWNFRVRGEWYRLAVDESLMCAPLSTWSSRDAFAAAVLWGLPIHAHYRRLFEVFDVSPESPHARVDSMIPEDRITAWPARDICATLYPDIWTRLVAARPELAWQARGATLWR
jgi:3'-phosphoadenosine 5'-phosphosulfate sulfotransferase (PAPS reductase)/FAD synthetase